MDLSKLPKLSQTSEAEKQRTSPPQPDPMADAQPRPPIGQPIPPTYADPIIGAEVWISAVLGLLFTYLGTTFARYLFAVLRAQPFHTGVDWTDGPKAGQEVAYFELQGYTALTDASLFLFGLALLADAAMLLIASGSLARRTWLVWLGFGLTLLALAFNLITCVMTLSAGIFPLFSFVAIAIGGYMAAYQWRLVSAPKQQHPTTPAV